MECGVAATACQRDDEEGKEVKLLFTGGEGPVRSHRHLSEPFYTLRIRERES